ncbi:MAG: type II secretion system F family protein [Pirellulales bacterium]|nr:type II secretion system F family protein [Pirellulales bacterium]
MIERIFLPSLTLFLLGIALRVSLRLLYGARGPAADDGLYLFMRVMSWTLLVAPGVVFIVSTMHWASLLLLIVIFESVVELVVARRQAHRESAWRLLMMAVASGQPLGWSLRFHQARFKGIVGRAYRRLVADLEHGAPPIEAAWANRAALPREAPAYLGVLAASPTQASTARQFVELEDAGVVEVRQHIYQRFAYLATVAAFLVAVLVFVLIKIVPSYQEIFADFDLELPKVTRSFIGFANSAGVAMAIPIVAAFLLMILSASAVGIMYLCDVPVLRPLTDRLGFSNHRAHVLRLLAASFAQGVPVAESLAHLAEGRLSYPSLPVRRRLYKAQHLVASGDEWQSALEQSSLINANDAATLRAAQQAGNLPWAMQMLADRKLRLLAFRWSAIENVLFTAVILLLGAVVFWYAVAMFVPLTQMIQALS